MGLNTLHTLIYLDINIEWHKDILNTCCNDYDRKWKKGQIDMLGKMIKEIENEDNLRNASIRNKENEKGICISTNILPSWINQ